MSFKLLSFFVVAVAMASLSSCGPSKTQWAEYKSSDGGFSVSMPAGITTSQKTEVTPFGKQTVHFVSWKPSAFSISKVKRMEVRYMDCPVRVISDSIMTEVMLDSSINMRKKDFTEKEINSESVSFNGYPGRAFIWDQNKDNTTVILKEFLANGHLYDLVVIVKSNQGTSTEAADFFNSFQIIRQ